MAEHNESNENYGSPRPAHNPLGNNGYPNKVANTQTQKMRGAGAATKGTGHSKKMG